MNWRWILMLAALGVVMGIASTFGWTAGKELWLWIGLMLIAAVLLGYTVKTKLFKHGFFTAALWTLLDGIIVFSMWDTYMANNPQAAEQYAKIPEGMDPRYFSLIGIVFTALISGAVLGLLTMLAGKLLAEKETTQPAEKTEVEA